MGILGYESDFSPDGRRFAILDGDDGKLRIWDTKEDRLEQDYVPNAHLSGPYTCLVWCQICTGNVSEACNGKNISLYIALGTSRGGVDLYSHATGKLDRKLRGIQTKQDKSSDGIVHAGAVTCICLHANNSTLYTAGEDCQIFEWSLKECSAVRSFSIGKNTPTRIVSLPLSNTLLVGCKTLHQWSLDGRKPKLMATLTGHSADVSSMKEFHFADTREEYVATTAKNNREIYLWKIGSQSSKGTFLMEHAGSVASCSVTDGKLIIAAITRGAGGKVHLFVVEDISDIGKKPRHPKVTLSVALDSGKEIAPYPIEAATTNFSKAHSSSILIGYGKPSGLSFVEKLYNLNDKVQVVEPKQPKNQVNRQEKNNEMFKTYVPGDGVIPHIPGETPRPPRKTPGDTPISKHLELLDSTVETDDAKGYSLVETLKQALNNHDATNIRIVLATKDENVIRSTLKRLPAKSVPSLIDQLTLLTHKKTANVQVAVRWLKLLLQIHASQLMALGKDELHHRFGALLGIIDHRTQALSKLSKLSGRLDFLLNQIKRNTDDDLQLTHENLLVYEDDVEASSDVNTKSDDEGGNTTDEDTVDLENGQDESMDDEDENFVDTTDGSSN